MPTDGTFEMVAKTFQGLEQVLAEELRDLGAQNVEPGRRMVSFEGDLKMLYRANMCCRTALRILKPFYKFAAANPDELYDRVKEYDWEQLLSSDKTFSIDTVSFSDEFTHSRFVTYRVKDGIVDFFKDRYGDNVRPGVRLQDADVMINVHISGHDVTLSLDSSGESLHKRGYRVAQTEAPINEVLAAGIILLSGWRGDCPLVDPMCGSGTFLIEAALIGAGINPGIYRRHFAFENWPDFDAELFDSIYNDDSGEREFKHKIYGADISPKAIAISRENIKSAGVSKYIDLAIRPISQWTEEDVPKDGILVTNPPYGERISAPDMDQLYTTIGSQLKFVFKGYHAWIIGYHEEYFHRIGLAPSMKVPLYNGALECELREYEIFDGDMASFRRSCGKLHKGGRPEGSRRPAPRARREGSESGSGEVSALEEKLRPKRGPKAGRPRGAERGEFKPRARHAEEGEFKPRARSAEEGEFKPRARRAEGGFKGRRPDRDGDGGFKGGRRPDHDSKRGPKGWHDSDERRGERSERTEESENPLAARRNPAALSRIVGKQPQLPPANMRSRRGWKRPTDEGGDNAPDTPAGDAQ